MTRGALVAAALVLATAAAHAQSKRYPPEPEDRDRETEAKSELWEAALHPDTRPYRDLVRDAKRMIDNGVESDAKTALDKLATAIERVPAAPDAYLARGTWYLHKKQWAKCAEDLAAADERAPKLDGSERIRLRIDLANCLARSGHLADAERTLLYAAALVPPYRGEVYTRLGEVRVAMGKLDEAIDALTTAVDSTEYSTALARWLLALAYDRARKPGEAKSHAEIARSYDTSYAVFTGPSLPLLGAGDSDYLLGLAYALANVPLRPEYALVSFRRFLKTAPDSPWRRRAEEHVRELAGLELPLALERTGTASVDADIALAAVRKAMPMLRACLTKAPAVYQIEIVKVGARTPDSIRDRPVYRLPPAGVRATVQAVPPDVAQPADPDTQKCLEAAANKIALPPPKDKDTYYRAFFLAAP